MIDEGKARSLVERVLVLAGATRGAQAMVSLRAEHAGHTRFARSEITSSGDVDRVSLAVTTHLGQRSATATTNQLDDRSVDDVVAQALRMARLAPESPEVMPPLGKTTYAKIKPAVDHDTAKLGAGARVKAAAAAIAAADAGKVTLAGFYEHAETLTVRATTAGLWAAHPATSCSFSCTARTPDATGSGWAGAASNRAADLDVPALAHTAVDKAVHSQKPHKLDAGRYTVVLEPAAVASLLQLFAGALDARRADEGRSFFSKHKVGDKLFPETITLRSDPGDAAVNGTPFDRDGVALQPTKWVDRGALAALVYSRYWASKQGKAATGTPDGWTLEGGKASREELIKGVTRGVLITRFWYLRMVDPQTILVTGLTRDGTFLIENGEVTAPVNNFRFNESPVQMLARCDGLGPTAIPGGGENDGGIRVPILRTHEFNLASISEAV
jgi:predicted Zn-dependent protease